MLNLSVSAVCLRCGLSSPRMFTGAFVFVACLCLSLQSSFAKTVNLLPLGDSITEDGLYIDPLTNLLLGNGDTPNLIANEGHSGFVIDKSVNQPGHDGLLQHIGTGNATTEPRDFLLHPNVNSRDTYILLMIGTNDVRFDSPSQLDTIAVQSRMTALLSAIHKEAPLAQLIVAQIIPNQDPLKKDLVPGFNSAISAVATGPNTSLVDMYSAFMPDPSLYLRDAYHPNQAGGNVMAQVWFRGIEAIPEPSDVLLAAPGVVFLLGARELKRAGIRKRQRLSPSQFSNCS